MARRLRSSVLRAVALNSLNCRRMSAQLIGLCSTSCPFASGECDAGVDCCCEAKVRLESSLHKYFGFSTFRPGQLDALLPVLHGRDVFVRMATGAGKSLCIFLAPLALSDSAVGIVISPLNGLMDQQVSIVVYLHV